MGLPSLLFCKSNPQSVQLKIKVDPSVTETSHFVNRYLEKIQKPENLAISDSKLWNA